MTQKRTATDHGFGGARALFVYWRCDAADSAEALRDAAAWLAAARRDHPGLTTRLYRRDDPTRSRVTVMETYSAARGIDPALDTVLVTAAATALGRYALDGRHVERFDAVDDDPA